MDSGLTLERYILPIAIGGTGVVLAWLANEPSGLLAAVTGICILGGRRVSLWSTVAFALALAGFMIIVGWRSTIEHEAYLQLATFLAVGFGISGLFHLNQIAASSGQDEKEARLIVESMPGHGWSADASGNFVYVSPNTLKYLGHPGEGLDRIDGTDDFGWRQAVHPDDYDRVVARWLHSLKTGEPYENEHRIRRSDGTYRWFRNFAQATRDADGRITGWYGTSIDIDDRINAVDALRRSERRPQQLIDAVPALIWCTTPQGTPSYVNKRLMDAVGVTLDDLTTPDASRSLADVHPEHRPAVEQALAHSLKRGVPFAMTYRQRRADGSYRWTEGRAEPLRAEDGSIVQWYGVCVDIDELMSAQEALTDRERELSQLVDMVPSHVWRLTPDGEPIFFNKRMADYLGLDVTDMDKPGVSRLEAVMETVHPDDAKEFRNTLNQCLGSGESFALRYRLRRADGVYRWMSSRAEPMRDQAGRIVQWYGLCHDINDQVVAEDAVQRSERKLQRLVDAVPVQIWCSSPEGDPTYINKRLQEFMGFELEDFDSPGEPRRVAAVRNQVHPDDVATVRDRLTHCRQTGKSFAMRYRMRRADGVYRWVEGRSEPFRDENGSIVQWYGVLLDIHDEVRAQQALTDRERELSQLVDMVPSLLWRLSSDGEPIFFSKRMIDFVGLNISDADKTNTSRLAAIIKTVVHPDDAATLQETLTRSLITGERFRLRYRLRRADGAHRWMEGRAEPLRREDGRILQWYGLSHDIDDQVHIEEALRQSERQLRQLVETLPALIYCAAPDGHPIYRSQKLRDFLGINGEDEDKTGRSPLDGTLDTIIHPDDLAGVKENYAHSLATGEPYARRHRLRRFDDEYRWVETRAAPMLNAEGAIVQWNGVCLEIEDQVRAQEKLRQAKESLARASQAASLAELSASIAHEVNQPLAAIVATSHACRRWLSADPPNLERAGITLERIIRDANSASEVVSRIRALFSQMGETRSLVDVTEVIAEVQRLMTDELAIRNIRVETEFASDLPAVLMDRIQMQQVLVNLIRNAIDALEMIADGMKLIRLRAVMEGDHAIRVEVRDLGAGITEPERVFDPFFTTKENGMGMGLAICRSIIESHDGQLWAAANEPRGTTFAFTLPVAASEVAA